MKRRELVIASIGTLFLLPGLFFAYISTDFEREERITAGPCAIPISKISDPSGGRNAVVVFHGLSANRRLMATLGRWLSRPHNRVYLIDLPGHGDNSESFSFARAETCAASLLETLERAGEIRPERTVLIGHSMGGAIAIRMADVFPVAGTVAISPAPLVPAEGAPQELIFFSPPRRMPSNLLLMVGGLEPRFAESASRELLKRSGGERTSLDDFIQRRAAALHVIPDATHTSLIFDSHVPQEIARWTCQSIETDLVSMVIDVSPIPLYAVAIGLLGLAMIFPGFASLLTRNQKVENHGHPSPPAARMLVAWAVAAVITVSFLYVGVPLRPIVRMYSGDYLTSVLMIVGVLVLMWQVRAQRAAPLQWNGRALASAAVLGMATILAFGAWLNWQITDTWLNAPRWWRFAVLVPLVLPYFVAEEITLGAPPSACLARTGRFARFLTLRAILWLAMAFGLFVLGSAQVLMALLVIYMAGFSIAQRAGMDAVRRRTGSAAAAAVFGAILAAWFIAAVFPIT